MKKIIILLLSLILIGCTKPEPEKKMTLRELLDSITISNEVSEDINLPQTYMLNGSEVYALWASNKPNVISIDGKVNRQISDEEVILTLTLTDGVGMEEKPFTVKVVGYDNNEIIHGALDKISILDETKYTLTLPKFVSYLGQRFDIVWKSSNTDALSDDGKTGLITNDTDVTMTASITYNNTTLTKNFTVKVKAYTDQEKADYIFNNLKINLKTDKDIELPTTFTFGLTGTWESSDTNVISHDGKINKANSGVSKATLTLTLSNNLGRTFEVEVTNNNHMIIDRTFDGTKENVQIENGKLVLEESALTGTYTTEEFTTFAFTEAVASWAAITSTEATCELFIRVYVDGAWSQYFSYGKWGKGLNNKAVNQNDSIAYLSTDEVKLYNSKVANKVQMKIVLTRNNLSTTSPIVSLVAVALNIPGYTYHVDTTNLPTEVDYDVPQLYQHVVPVIGGIICSATSSTMLLNYKGHDFNGLAPYQHEYIAAIVKDYGHNIYGNWVYNTVGMSSFGEISYVKRMYSYQELLVHLHEVGPISASIKGTVVVRLGNNYSTDGHLIVVRGYRYEGSQLYILVNDPNLKNVYDEMKVEDFMKVWRNVIYVVE